MKVPRGRSGPLVCQTCGARLYGPVEHSHSRDTLAVAYALGEVPRRRLSDQLRADRDATGLPRRRP